MNPKICNDILFVLYHKMPFCSSQPSMVHWLSSSIFPFCRLFVCPAMVTSDQISTFFNIYRHKSVVLTQFNLIPSSTKLYWPSTTKYQPIPPHTDPSPPNTSQYCPVLSCISQFHPTLTQYHQVPTSTTLYWPIVYQPLPPSTDPVLPYINVYRSILTQYRQVLPVPSHIDIVLLHTDPTPPSTSQYRSILTQYHQYRHILSQCHQVVTSPAP